LFIVPPIELDISDFSCAPLLAWTLLPFCRLLVPRELFDMETPAPPPDLSG